MNYIKNNNDKIISKLANRSLKINKNRNIAAVITIAFSLCVILSLVLTALSINQINYNSVKDTYQASLKDISEKEIANLSDDNRIYKVGVACFIDYIQIPNGNIVCAYYNDVMIDAQSNINGTLPKNEDEVLVSQSYLNISGKNTDVGGVIELNIGRNIKGSFKVTGIIDDEDLQGNIFYLLFSKPFIEQLAADENEKYNAYIWLQDVHSLSANETRRQITQTCEDYGIDAGKVSFNSPYLSYIGQSLSGENILGIILIGSLILFAGAIVVYTIFYISIGNKIREYGQLRTLGATKKQIKRIVVYEGMTLAIIGSVAGVLLGWIVGYALQPDGWHWENTFWATIAVVLFEICVVWLSVRAPAKLAEKASPIEAGRYSTYTFGISTRRIKTRCKKSTPLRIAFLNIVRSPKKAAFTMLSLGLCGVLFMSAASLQMNITAEKMVRYEQFRYGNYMLTVIGGENNSFSEIQQIYNPLNEELRQKILALNGIENIHEWKAISGSIPSYDGTYTNKISIYGYAPQNEEDLTNALLDGTADYDKLSLNNGLIVYSPGDIKSFYGWEPRLGDTVKFTTLAGSGEYVETSLVVMGITGKNDNLPGFFRMTDSALQQITGTACIDSWELVTDYANDNMTATEQQLIALLQDSPYIQFETYAEALEQREAELSVGWGMFFLLSLLLGVFGIINLINANTTNLFSRKQEIGMLQAVGMTGKQLRISLLLEGVANTLIATVITVLLGLPIGYMACFWVNENLLGMYNIPWQAALLYLAALSVVSLLLTVYDVWIISKTPVIERINIVA